MCPQECTCHNLNINCTAANLETLPEYLPKRTRKLNFAENRLNITMDLFGNTVELAELNLSANGIGMIVVGTFSKLNNLYLLDLSYNQIVHLENGALDGLVNLLELRLEGNIFLRSVDSGTFKHLDKLPSLDLSGSSFRSLNTEMFQGLDSVKVLNLSKNQISEVQHDAFLHLKKLVKLDLRENNIEEFNKDMFLPLTTLQSLQSDDFKFCCLAPMVHADNCLPFRDELSSCEDLMRNDLLRMSLWIIGLVALVGNVFVIAVRIHLRTSNDSHSCLITNLAISDFLIGTYLISIAAVDMLHRGIYIENAEKWKKSFMCQFLGLLSTMASEGSVFTLCLITYDRWCNVIRPFDAAKFNVKRAMCAIAAVWVFAFALAAFPLLPISYFGGEFYSRSGVCLSLYLTANPTPGWEYSVFIFQVSKPNTALS